MLSTDLVTMQIGNLPSAMMSRRPGIGSNYLQTHTDWHRANLRNYTQVNGQMGRLPRYYKDKIFTPAQRLRMADEIMLLSDEKYHEEIQKLMNFHDDPYYYYDERVQHAHESVIDKVNKLNTF